MTAMSPRTPVLVGAGQVNHRDDADERVDPVELMARAARQAGRAPLLSAVDAIRVVHLLSWRYRDPGLLLGQRIGAHPRSTYYSGVGGNAPQSLINQACNDIQAGRADVILLAGAEVWRTRTRLRAQGVKPNWPRQDQSVPPAVGPEDVPLRGEAEGRIGLDRPAYVYPMFEQAVRIAAAEPTEHHRRRIGELWAQFSEVAESNPHAWRPKRHAADDIWQPGPSNRMISWPYTKLLNANNMVNQAAVIILASAEVATRLRIPSERWVFPYAGTDAHDTFAIAQRAEYHRSPAIRIAGRRVFELAGLGIDDIDFVDVYSCFPCAVQIAATELGLPVGERTRPLTVTGGLTFAGGPWNNYVMHSIATLSELLVRNPGSRGLITANGGYLTKHSFGMYGTDAPRNEFRWEDVQSAVDQQPTTVALLQWDGPASVETWTVPFDRDGQPERVFVAARTREGARTLAVIGDASVAASVVSEDIAGARVQVRPDGTASLD
jgi:acetyl-CoA C-acetyltransferase